MSLEFLTADCINRKDLTLLADYLEKLPEGYDNFDMSSFIKDDCGPKETASKQNLCGTAGCAIGHAPFVKGIPAPFDGEYWSDYSDRIAFNKSGFISNEHETLWFFMFGGVWVNIDNTPHGAARRIRAVLKDHEKCHDFFEKNEMNNWDKLVYNEFLNKLGV